MKPIWFIQCSAGTNIVHYGVGMKITVPCGVVCKCVSIVFNMETIEFSHFEWNGQTCWEFICLPWGWNNNEYIPFAVNKIKIIRRLECDRSMCTFNASWAFGNRVKLEERFSCFSRSEGFWGVSNCTCTTQSLSRPTVQQTVRNPRNDRKEADHCLHVYIYIMNIALYGHMLWH